MPALMTGLFPSFEGVKSWRPKTWYGFARFNGADRQPGLPDGVDTLAEILREEGYRTAGFNTNPHLTKKFNFQQGFDYYNDFEDYLAQARRSAEHPMSSINPPAGVVMDSVIEWLKKTENDRFFIWLHLMDTHTPYLPPAPFNREFITGDSGHSDLQLNEAFHRVMVEQSHGRPPDSYVSMQTLGLSKAGLIEEIKRLYEGGIRYADAEIGRLCRTLREEGLWQNTLLVITADHGEEFLEHGYVSHHLLTAGPEELIRIPLLMHIPGLPRDAAGRKVEKLVRQVDIAPTILDYTGHGDKSSSMDGVSLRPFVEGKDSPALTAFISAIKFGIVRTERWKYRTLKHPLPGPEDKEFLFRIQADPLEKEDLASQYFQVVKKMRNEYKTFSRQLRRRDASAEPREEKESLPEIDEETRRRLRVLGYVQ
jgi:arylsulfatase